MGAQEGRLRTVNRWDAVPLESTTEPELGQGRSHKGASIVSVIRKGSNLAINQSNVVRVSAGRTGGGEKTEYNP